MEQNFALNSFSFPSIPTNTGIKGLVVREEMLALNALGSEPQIVAVPVAGATVSINPEMMQLTYGQYRPSSWMGKTDENGRFQANLLPGTYRVRAYTLSSGGQPNFIDSMLTVVQPGQFTDVELRKRITPVPSATAQEIYRVDDLQLKSTGPEALIIEARGTVISGGWSHGQLVPRVTGSSSVLEFDFVADPPTGFATLALESITATVTIQHPQPVETVRVYSMQNFQEITAAHIETSVKSAR